jgi:hypothetical protein
MKKIIVLLFSGLIFLAACGAEMPLAGSAADGDNALGNAQNWGQVTFYNERIYYFDFGSGDRALVSSKPDGSDKVKILDRSESEWISNIVVTDGWIYYCSGFIGKVRINGEDNTILRDQNPPYSSAHNLQIIGDLIYFQVEEFIEGGGIVETEYSTWKMKTDGSNLTKITDGGLNMLVYDNWIYYLDVTPDRTMHGQFTLTRIKPNGSGREKLLDNNIQVFTIDSGYLYYSNKYTNDGDNGIFSLNLKDMNIKKLSDDNCYYINAQNDAIFYVKDEFTNENKIYKYDLNTAQSIFMNANGFRLNIAGDRLFYQYSYDDNGYYKTALKSVIID